MSAYELASLTRALKRANLPGWTLHMSRDTMLNGKTTTVFGIADHAGHACARIMQTPDGWHLTMLCRTPDHLKATSRRRDRKPCKIHTTACGDAAEAMGIVLDRIQEQTARYSQLKETLNRQGLGLWTIRETEPLEYNFCYQPAYAVQDENKNRRALIYQRSDCWKTLIRRMDGSPECVLPHVSPDATDALLAAINTMECGTRNQQS